MIKTLVTKTNRIKYFIKLMLLNDDNYNHIRIYQAVP